MHGRLQGSFLWVDEDPDRIDSVRAGKILVSPVGKKVPKPVPSGLIHDWIGAAFIPDVRLADVLSAVRDYAHYKEFYKPTVVDAKPLGTEGGCDKYSMRVVNKERVAETALDMRIPGLLSPARRTTLVQHRAFHAGAGDSSLRPA